MISINMHVCRRLWVQTRFFKDAQLVHSLIIAVAFFILPVLESEIKEEP
jgi:hypothetical protein